MDYRTLFRDESRESPCALISLVTACKRAGYLFDLWHDDPNELLSILEKTWNQRHGRHPLALLFSPSLSITCKDFEDIERRDSQFGMEIRVHDVESNSFQKGDAVKAVLAPEMKILDEGGEKFFDSSREWYHATIRSVNEDGTYTIDWEGDYPGDRIKRPEEMMHLLESSHLDGVQSLLARCKSSVILWRDVAAFFFLSILITVVPEVIFFLITQRHICSRVHEETHRESLRLFCEVVHEAKILGQVGGEAMGVLLGGCCIGFVFCLSFIVFPCCYTILSCCCAARAKKLRRLFTFAVDVVHKALLPNVYGVLRIRIIVALGASYLLTCLCLSILLLAPGVIPLGFVTTQLCLRVMNTIMGDQVGLKHIQESRILTILTKMLKRCEIDLSEESLRYELKHFLALPHDACIVQLSLPLITLLASVLDKEKPLQSVRIHKMLVGKAYAAFTHAPKQLAQLKARHDIIVDVFRDFSEVPGLNILGERWAKEGGRLPWHLSIDRQAIQHFEEQFQGLGLPPGEGCFTWRSPRNGLWKTRENHNSEARIHAAKHLLKKQYEYDSTLNDLVHNSAIPDRPKLTFALLKVGANPDFRTDLQQPKSSTLVRACMSGKLESVKLLISCKADISDKRGIRNSIMRLDSPHFAPIREDVVQLLEQADLERAPLDSTFQSFPRTTFITTPSNRGSRSPQPNLWRASSSAAGQSEKTVSAYEQASSASVTPMPRLAIANEDDDTSDSESDIRTSYGGALAADSKSFSMKGSLIRKQEATGPEDWFTESMIPKTISRFNIRGRGRAS